MSSIIDVVGIVQEAGGRVDATHAQFFATSPTVSNTRQLPAHSVFVSTTSLQFCTRDPYNTSLCFVIG